MNARTRTTGYTVSDTDEQLEKVSDEMIKTDGGKNFKPVTPFEINTALSKIFEDSQKRAGGLQFTASHDIGSALLQFKRKSIERQGGDGQPLKGSDDNRPDEITETGRWSHSGKGNSRYDARIPLEIMKQDGDTFLPEIYNGGTGSFMLNISGSTDQSESFKASVSVMEANCLNGMESTMLVGEDNAVKHKNTKGLDIRELLVEAIRRSASNYHKFNMVTDQLKNAPVSTEQLCVFFTSAVCNGTIAGGNQKEIIDYFMDSQVNKGNQKYDSWFNYSDLSGYRLYNACTLWGEKQNSISTRKNLARGIWWSLADSGILPLPKSCTFPTNFKPILAKPEPAIIDISEPELIAV